MSGYTAYWPLRASASLLQALDFLQGVGPDSPWHAKAMEDLMDKLRLAPVQQTPAMQASKDLEEDVASIALEGAPGKFGPLAHQMATAVAGCGRERYADLSVQVDGDAYGMCVRTGFYRADGTGVDVKATGKWKGEQHYQDLWQARVYMAATNTPKFEYVVGVWDKDMQLEQVHTVTVHARDDDTQAIEGRIRDLMQVIHSDARLSRAYYRSYISGVPMVHPSQWLDG